MQILSSFAANGVTTVQTAHVNEEDGSLILAESSGETRKELIIEAAGAYELMLYLQATFEGQIDGF
jgi:hypothetical protein